MAVAHRPSADAIDWPTWDTPLRRFADATGLLICALDEDGHRRVGPHAGSKFGELLIDSGLFNDNRAGTHVERDLYAQLQRGQPCEEVGRLYGQQLRVQALPIRRDSAIVGAVVFGWVFADFPSSMGCERLAQLSGVDSHRLWSVARHQSPMSAARMTINTELLAAVVEWGSRLGEAAVALERLSLARDSFLAHVSHELRTPLNAIAMRVELLARTADDGEEVRRSLDAMRRHVADESRLVEDLLEAAVTKTGHFTVAMTQTDLADVIRRAVETVTPTAETRGVEVIMDVGAGPLPVLADEARLRQALWNVIANAVKFTPERGRVEVRVHRRPRIHVVEVTDQGPGIDAALLPTIFDAFVRSTRDNDRGLGLGLAIARQIIELHGGLIAVTSAPGQRGSRFTIDLPALT